MKPLYIISKGASAGINENCRCVAHIYQDKIIVRMPCLKWCRYTVKYLLMRHIIRDMVMVSAVLDDMGGGIADSAWRRIGECLEDDFTAA